MSARIILQPSREKSLLRKHPWIFSRAIKKVIGKPNSGETVEVYSDKGDFLCIASYSPESQIRARAWSFNANTEINLAFFIEQINKAKILREKEILPVSNGYRLIAAESDGLPGVTVDFYNGVLVGQFLSAGAEYQKPVIVEALKQIFPNTGIYERSDVDVRKKEGLSPSKGWLFQTDNAATTVVIQEHGVKIELDIEQGHKTGFYLDQRDSRFIAGQYSKNKTVLNCFSYTGAFSLHALQSGASHVTNADISATAIAQAKRNHEINHLTNNVTFEKADVFKLLRKYKEQGKRFDTIVMDPPKFVENKNQLKGACRGYKDINMLAFQLLNPGGTLLTFSCSGLMEESLFQKIIADAALDAGREGKIIEKLSQAKDHPIGLAYPEGFYLKGLVVSVV
ncbi:23S rRNA (cytosine(1962)-C(5))-methyltransferase RlmI [Saccharobesus litoralis]|uniref:23S rRNA (Cytosine(1962)-C(5))-methyltransferase RlmI n=1 Tax=Saccharobesus litoralis TaxID=2172099 RepID=A0A2S0VUC2_9ALTE|nr:class I SAM-dependent methyltransferase [Saccharobesus litoralis]AWB67809.1 23S rRNA (cytosine(1962)-C(5))-methyltransferase RlmI [Saccharobesus litoralis]